MRQKLGLDRPLIIQYLTWMKGMLTLNVGDSLWSGRPVFEEVIERFPLTLELATLSIIISAFIAILTGVLSAVRQDTWVDYHNDDRAPLLFVTGSTDHIMPPSVQHSNAKHYKSEKTITEVIDLEGPHFMPALEGWEKIADHALDWALEHARKPATV